MPTFIVRQRRRQDRAWPLPKAAFVIGRGDEADLALPNVAVSRRHARVSLERDWVIEDLGTRNGTRVNGELVGRHTLKGGDRIVVGPYELVFLADHTRVFAARLVESFPLYRAGATDQGDHTFQLSRAELQAQLKGLKPLSERAELVEPDGRRSALGARTWWFGEGEEIEVGVKGRVAEIRWEVDHHLLVRLAWLGRVKVNGRRVKEQALEPGDQLEIGRARFRYEA